MEKFVLGIDTGKTQETKVYLKDEKGKIVKILIEVRKSGSQVLLPLILEILKSKNLDFKNLSAIEVNCGPGSFTGLRIGVSVANALGYTLKIPVNGEKVGEIVIPKYEP